MDKYIWNSFIYKLITKFPKKIIFIIEFDFYVIDLFYKK